MDIAQPDYICQSFIIGISCANVPGVGFSGVSVRDGSLVRIELRGLPTVATGPIGALAPTDQVDRAHCNLLATQFCEIREGGVSAFD